MVGAPTERRPIRTLVNLLAALLVAIGLVVAGYSFALTLQRPAVTVAEATIPAATIVPPTAPERLRFEGEPRAFAAPAAARGASATASATTRHLVVRGLVRDQLGERAGLAMFSPEGGTVFAWIPLAVGEATADGALDFELEIPAGEVTLTLAPAEEFVHHGYLARTDLSPGDPMLRTVELGAHATAFTTADGRAAGPLRLVRRDDPEWRPLAAAPNGLFVEAGGTTVLLGDGAYELVDPIDPALRQTFDVPAAGPIAVEPRLARPRAQKP
ncbi:MAG: hypothetical protein KDE27_11450 [Planctomycetes bacterium]|nr:hypothetical protein [Planctomycetota bacterium]